MSQTIAEKIISSHCGHAAHTGETVVASVDLAMATDGSGPLAIELFEQMNTVNVFDPTNIIMVLDHYVPCPNDKVARLHDRMRKFCRENSCRLFDLGEGIGHQLLSEKGLILPGSIAVGADSHAGAYGAFNALGTGIGSSDLAAVMATGKLWFKVPQSMRFELKGYLTDPVCAKDLALHIVGRLGSSGANYKSLEFYGPPLLSLDMDDRMTLCNMMVETGAKCTIMPFDTVTENFLAGIQPEEFTPVTADYRANYENEITVDLNDVAPQIAAPHQVDNVFTVNELEGTPIDMVVIGTCTNGRLKDLQQAAAVMHVHGKANEVEMLVVPASRRIFSEAASLGLLEIFSNQGAMVLPPGCGPCCGSSAGIPGDDKNILSTANRNFLGRMGNVNANIYLGSPVSVAAAAVTGRITDPRRLV